MGPRPSTMKRLRERGLKERRERKARRKDQRKAEKAERALAAANGSAETVESLPGGEQGE